MMFSLMVLGSPLETCTEVSISTTFEFLGLGGVTGVHQLFGSARILYYCIPFTSHDTLKEYDCSVMKSCFFLLLLFPIGLRFV